jgi:hypothetical protein
MLIVAGFNFPAIPFSADFRGIDHIALKFMPPPDPELESIRPNDDEFCPVPMMPESDVIHPTVEEHGTFPGFESLETRQLQAGKP